MEQNPTQVVTHFTCPAEWKGKHVLHHYDARSGHLEVFYQPDGPPSKQVLHSVHIRPLCFPEEDMWHVPEREAQPECTHPQVADLSRASTCGGVSTWRLTLTKMISGMQPHVTEDVTTRPQIAQLTTRSNKKELQKAIHRQVLLVSMFDTARDQLICGELTAYMNTHFNRHGDVVELLQLDTSTEETKAAGLQQLYSTYSAHAHRNEKPQGPPVLILAGHGRAASTLLGSGLSCTETIDLLEVVPKVCDCVAPPELVVLFSCESGGSASKDDLANSLGGKLAHAIFPIPVLCWSGEMPADRSFAAVLQGSPFYFLLSVLHYYCAHPYDEPETFDDLAPGLANSARAM